MSDWLAINFDWARWREAFGLGPSALWEAPDLFPLVSVSKEPGDPPLTADALLASFSAPLKEGGER